VLNLDPGKLLVIAVVAVILLGPDRLPQVARQVGTAWRAFTEFRHRMEAEVRSNIPDLPSTSDIARLVRSPSALLDHLGNMASASSEPDGVAGTVNTVRPATDPVSAATSAERAPHGSDGGTTPMSWVTREYPDYARPAPQPPPAPVLRSPDVAPVRTPGDANLN
jgi:sec-independent protein translocase protein TatB